MSNFSFGRILLGFGCGITIPYIAHENVYYCIATCFYVPHLKYHKEKQLRHKDAAIPVEALDAYMKDVFGSFFLFFLIIGPTLYKTYVKNEDIFNGLGQGQGDISKFRDSYTDILLKMKGVKA